MRPGLYIIYTEKRDTESLLGAQVQTIVPDDYNDITTQGIYFVSKSLVANRPTTAYGTLRVIGQSSNCIQIFSSDLLADAQGADSRIFWRKKRNNDWSPWNEIYDTSILTNSSLLSQLASALDGVIVEESRAGFNIDECFKTKRYFLYADASSTFQYGALLFVFNFINRVFQIAFDFATGKLRYRVYNYTSSSWGDWVTIATS